MVAEANKRIQNKLKKLQSKHGALTRVNLHVMDWVAVKQEDPILQIVMECISSHKVLDLKHLLGNHSTMEEGMAILREWKKFLLHQGVLYHHHTTARELEEAMWFVVPMAHRVVVMNECHKDARYQGQWKTLSLLQDQFW